ncbi:MAG: ATP-binding protein [Thermoplasmata archaeon]|nr:ATP-binding protein [Thermoplasmata archaeon]
MFADPMLEKVFYNLIDNSIRHGGAVRNIKFSFLRDRDGMRIICQDDGIGIPVEHKTSIFKRDSGMEGEQRGYGLYLAKEILGITGMTISENGTAGECAMFVIHIPPGKYRTKPQLRKRKSQRPSY